MDGMGDALGRALGGFARALGLRGVVVLAWVALLTTVSAWVTLGARPGEIGSLLRAWRAVAARGVIRARDLARRAVDAAAARFGIRDADARRPTLGEVAEMTDVIRLGLTAGLSFDAALGLYCENRAGALSRRMARARLSWQMGMGTREDELMAAALDLGVRPLESFATAVGQALGLGAPLAATLAAQGREMRAAHRAEVERQIEQASVKLLIPTGTLILPALLLSIVGPLLAASGMI